MLEPYEKAFADQGCSDSLAITSSTGEFDKANHGHARAWHETVNAIFKQCDLKFESTHLDIV